VGRFSQTFANYSFQVIDIYQIDQKAIDQLNASVAATGSAGVPVIDASILGDLGRRYESRITPSWVRNTVDNPYQPRRGTRHTASLGFVGGPLGGTVNYYRPTFETVYYRPFGRRMALGLRAEAAYIRPFGATSAVPYYQRYFLGGETQLRGYDVRTVAPFDAKTSTSLGGNKYLLLNAEYYFDIAGPVRFLLFYDAGEAYPEGRGFYWKTLRTSTGAELRFVMPVLNVPFRLIYAWNANRDYFQPRTAFKFAVGTTF
jgi:outer membrane protein insertion porin family